MKLGIYAKGASTVAAAIALASLTCQQVSAATGIGVFPDSNFYILDQDIPNIAVSGFSTEGVAVDVYVGAIAPDGTIYTYTNAGWGTWGTSSAEPLLSNFTLPASFTYPATPLYNLSGVPGGLVNGIWFAAAALTVPGTGQLLSFDTVPFQVIDENATGSAYGAVILSHEQTSEGIKVDASAAFVQAGGNFNDLITNYEGNQPGLNACVFNEIPIDFTNIQGLSIQTLDAGESITMAPGSGNSATLTKDANAQALGFTFYSANVDASFYQGGATYSSSNGSGGPGLGGFNVSVKAPAALNLSSPDISSTISHDASTDLDLTWNGANDIGEVEANLSGGDQSNTYSIDCRFSDDGNGTIPANLLTQLRDKLQSGSSSIPGLPPGTSIPGFGTTANLNVMRIEYTLFNTAQSELSMGIATASSGADGEVNLE